MSEDLVCQSCGHQLGNHRCQLRDCDCAEFVGERTRAGLLATKLAERLVASIGNLQHVSTDRQNLSFARQIQRFIDTHLVELQVHLTDRMLLEDERVRERDDDPRGGAELQQALEKL